jgi:hypothetical protein
VLAAACTLAVVEYLFAEMHPLIINTCSRDCYITSDVVISRSHCWLTHVYMSTCARSFTSGDNVIGARAADSDLATGKRRGDRTNSALFLLAIHQSPLRFHSFLSSRQTCDRLARFQDSPFVKANLRFGRLEPTGLQAQVCCYVSF